MAQLRIYGIARTRAFRVLCVAKELGLSSLPHDRCKWIEIMVANPILIERPILVTDDGRAAVGRPTEALKPLL